MNAQNNEWHKLAEVIKLNGDETAENMPTHQKIYDLLRHAVMIGKFGFGESLTIRGLAEQLDVSPTPVREAIRRLSAEGALEILDTRRIILPKMDKNRFESLIALRKLLECHAAETALPYVSDFDISEITDIDNEMDRIIAENDFSMTVILNQKFHSRLYSVNPSQVILPSIESVWLQLGPYTRLSLSNLKELYPVDHHKTIIKALKARNSKKLKEAVNDDIEDGIARCGRLFFSEK